jgi:hypothetical protein
MTDLPERVDIHEEGPREGVQIEPTPILTFDSAYLSAYGAKPLALTLLSPIALFGRASQVGGGGSVS